MRQALSQAKQAARFVLKTTGVAVLVAGAFVVVVLAACAALLSACD